MQYWVEERKGVGLRKEKEWMRKWVGSRRRKRRLHRYYYYYICVGNVQINMYRDFC